MNCSDCCDIVDEAYGPGPRVINDSFSGGDDVVVTGVFLFSVFNGFP